jgi:hypothetical protein
MGRKRGAAVSQGTTDPGCVSIAGYSAVQLPVEQPGNPEDSGRWIYLRAHAPGVLFLANLPESTDVSVVRCAVPAARDGVDAIEVRTMPGSSTTKFSRIYMRGGEADVKAVLEHPKDWLALEFFVRAEGIDTASPAENWLEQYWQARQVDQIEKWSAATMATFERQEEVRAEAKKREDKDAAKPDDDGFVVVRRGATAVDTAGGVVVSAFNPNVANNAKLGKRKRERGVPPDGFYRWQRRESRQKEVDDLRKRFEDDKKRVAAVRNLSV